MKQDIQDENLSYSFKITTLLVINNIFLDLNWNII